MTPPVATTADPPGNPREAAPSAAARWGVSDLTVRYGARTALEGVTLAVPAGAVTAVIGGDGAGKTTLLRALAGVVHPASGRVDRPARRRIGYVAGAAGLYADLTVAENVEFVRRGYGLTREQCRHRLDNLLGRAGLTGTEDRLAGRLSGGMRQKLAFALAMLHEPDLLILDEPTTGVDPASRADLWSLIAGAAAAGAAVVLSTTYLDEARRAARIVLLTDGRVQAAGDAGMLEPELRAASRQMTAGRAAPARAATDGAASPRTAAAGPSAPSRRGAPNQRPLAAAEALVRRFGAVTAVDGVDLTLHAGEVIGLLGANGAGKTTLIRLLLGLLRPTSGRALLFGKPPTRAARARLGYVPQGLGLWQELTVAENLSFVAAAFGSPTPALEPALAEAADTLVRKLPLGLRRRLAFVAALAHSPELLVLDEPTSGVGLEARAALWRTIREAADAGAGVLVTTHHLDEADECDRLVLMSAGRVVATGSVAEIVGDGVAVAVAADRWDEAFAALDEADLPVALVGRGLRVAGGDLPRVRAALDARQVAARLSVTPATFEETFVRLTRHPDPERTSS